jgi:hypothetical protein
LNQSFTYKNLNFWIIFVILFSSGCIFFKIPFEFYFHYIFLFSLTPFFLIKFGLPKYILQLFIIPFVIGLVHIALKNNLTFTFLKIFGGLLISLIFFESLLKNYNYNILYVFELYCKACWILVLIAIFQILSYLIGFEYGYNYSWLLNKWGFVDGGLIGFRVNSILSEPTYLATSLSPVVFVSIRNLINNDSFIFSKFKSLIIVIISILTTSSIGYLGIIISLLFSLKLFRLRYIIFAILISTSGFIISYKNVSDFSSRVNSARGLWIEEDFKIENTNNSSFVLYNNLHIAKENLMKHPLFGTGLGSHETAFKKFTLTKSLIQYDFEFNVKDGNSLFVRLCTETGLIGLIFILIIIYNGFIYKSHIQYDTDYHMIISQAIFVFILLVLIRQGNYMLNGLPLMFLLYHYNKTSYNDKVNSSFNNKN